MTLEKAIEILERLPDPDHTVWEPDSLDAIKLGIEGLKRLKEGRQSFIPHIVALLPGETKE